MTKHVLVSIDDLKQKETLEELSLSVSQAIERFELTSFMFAGVPAPGHDFQPYVLISNWPETWLSRYVSERYVHIDPVVQHCFSTNLPFDWREAPLDRSPESGQVLYDFKVHGIAYGYCVPIQLASGVQGFASFGGPKDSVDSAGQIQLHLLALHVYAQIRKLNVSRHQLPKRRAITQREAEVLKWAALGKTAAEIADITALSVRTVNQHCENAQRRLGTHNRIHTVVEAIRHKLITL
ncbi:LuxR family transcriptional regulator [Devosia sp. WQ 349]|uniref:helix-turn-helix transcriptional regulator n=1 Tax=Devosia sp. WQ 349K1 TaxID=2800329 RepID=UPI00190709CC|nr:LuxR family transcriptional regulator [Devosia sp. WQ 349K1]MBK1795945.1 LuxR family transcriptional regulator [Devosia sp. WQ 349K1]